MGDIMNNSSIYNTTTGSEGYETAKEDQSSVQYYSILEQDDTLQDISGISLDNCSTTPTRCDQEANANIDQEHLMLSGKSHLDFDTLQHTDVDKCVQDGVEDTDELSVTQNMQDAISPGIQPQTAGQIVETTEGRMILYKLEGSDELYAIPVDNEELTQDNEADNQLLHDDNNHSENEENEEVLIQYSFGSAAGDKSDDDVNEISGKNILSEDLQVSCSNSDYEETTIEDVSCSYAYVKKQKEETHTSIPDMRTEDADKLNGCLNVSGDSVEQEEYLDEEYLEYETGDGEPVTGDSDIIYNPHLSETDSFSEAHNDCQGVIVVEPIETESFLKKDERKYYIQKDSPNIVNFQNSQKSPIESIDSLDLIQSSPKSSAKLYSKHLSNNNSSFSKKQISTIVSGRTLAKTPSNVCNTFKQYYTKSTKKQPTPNLETSTMDLTTDDGTDSPVIKSAENISPGKIKPRNRKQVLTVVDRPDAEIIFEPILTPEDQGKEKAKRGRKPKQSEGSLVSKSSESEVEVIPDKPKRKYTKSIKNQESTIVSPLRFSKRLSKKSKDIKTCRIKSCNCDLEHTSWVSGDSGTDDSHLAENSDSSVASDEWPMDSRTKKWVNKQQQKNDEEKLNSSKKEDNIINDEEEILKEVSSVVSIVKYDDSHSPPLEDKSEEKVSAAVLEEMNEYSFLLNKNADMMTWFDKSENTDNLDDFSGFFPQYLLITSPNGTEETLNAESISKLHSIYLDTRKPSTSVLAKKENVETKSDVNSYDTNKNKYSTRRLTSFKKKIIVNKQKRSANSESVVVPPKKSKLNDIPAKATKDIKPESFICRICDKNFRQYTHLLTHQNMHKKVGFVKCKHCSREFPFQSGLNAHIKKCPKVNEIETEKVDTKQTEKKSDAILSNSFEGIPFKNIASKLTYRIPNTKQSNAKLVASPFKSKRTMLVRKALGFSKYKCEKCSTQLTSAMGLASHMRLHDMKTSPQKQKTARSISRPPSMIPMKTSRLSSAAATLGASKRKTLGATKHEKSFLTVEHKELQENDHKRDLQGLRYISRIKKLSTPSNYNKKMETKGSALKSMISKKFKCVECTLVFKTQPEMARHRSCHSATKTFKCIECNKAFSSRALLNDHAGIHRIRKTSGKTNEAIIKPKTPASTTKRKPHGGVMLNNTLHKKLEELKYINK